MSLVLKLGDLRRETADLPDDTYVVIEDFHAPRVGLRRYTEPAVRVTRGHQTLEDLDYPFVPAGGQLPAGDNLPAICITSRREP